MAAMKELFGFILIIYSLPITTASSEIFAKFLDFKGTYRGVYTTCEVERINYSEFSSYFISIYDMRTRNKKIDESVSHLNRLSLNVAVFLDLNCANAREVLRNVSGPDIFVNRFWLLVGRSLTLIRDTLGELEIQINSDVTVAINDSRGIYKIYEVYRTLANELVIKELKEHFLTSSENKDVNGMGKSLVMRRKNFSGVTLKGGIVLPNNFTSDASMIAYLESKGNAHSDIMQRKNYQIGCLLQEEFNFSLKLIRSSCWGMKENNTWTGLIGNNIERKTNLTVTTLVLFKERCSVVDFLPPTHTFYSSFVFRHPQNFYLRNPFLEPFNNTVWIVILVSLVSSSLGLVLCVTLSHKMPSTEASSSNIGLVIIGAITQQGTSNIFHSIPSRILFSSVLILSFLLYQFYSAFLVASLLSESPKKIDSPQKLYDSGLDIGMEDVVYNYYLFNETSAISKKLLTNRILKAKDKHVVPMTEGLKLVKQGGFAYHADAMGAYRYLAETLTSTEFCQLKTVKVLPPIVTYITLPKKSPLKEFLANGILRMGEFGILDYEERTWRPDVPDCKLIGKSSDSQLAVGIENTLSLFVMLLVGMLVSVIILVMELVKFRIWKI